MAVGRGGKEGWRQNREQESEKDRGGGGRGKNLTQNHTVVKESNMEVVRQVLSESVSSNWEMGGTTTGDQPSRSHNSTGQPVRTQHRSYKYWDD